MNNSNRFSAVLPQCLAFALWMLLATLFLAFGDWGRELFEYRREAILDGELWRLLSAHFVHLGALHWLLNMLALYLFWWFGRASLPFFVWWLVPPIAALLISLGLLWFNPMVEWYMGFSGVLHGLWLAIGLSLLQQHRREALIWISVLGLKLLLEQTGVAPDSGALIGAPVLVDAHLYGALAGLVVLWPRGVHNSPDSGVER